eukprot:scaffold8094_cov103-Isochrysis_galbana.AAC.1
MSMRTLARSCELSFSGRRAGATYHRGHRVGPQVNTARGHAIGRHVRSASANVSAFRFSSGQTRPQHPLRRASVLPPARHRPGRRDGGAPDWATRRLCDTAGGACPRRWSRRLALLCLAHRPVDVFPVVGHQVAQGAEGGVGGEVG